MTNVESFHVWHWPADYFLARFESMQELYNAKQANDESRCAALMKTNPFVDDLEPVRTCGP